MHHLHHEHAFPVEPRPLLDFWFDEQGIRARHEAVDHDVQSVSVEQDGPDTTIVTVTFRNRPDLPGALRRAVPSVITMTQRDVWTRTADGGRGTWEVTSTGVPSRGTGTMRLDAVPGGARMVVDGDVTVSVPLLGGRLEALVCETSRKTLDRSHAYSVSHVLQST